MKTTVVFLLLVIAQVWCELKQVQVITRHGARTPFTIIPHDDVVWDCNLTSLSLPDQTDDSDMEVPRLYRKNLIRDRQVLPGTCYQGALTVEGYRNHYDLGVKLRKHYIDTLHFLPEDFDPSLIYIRSTNSERTIQSAEAQFLGLYPPATRKSSNGQTPVLDIFTIEGPKENLTPDNKCPEMVNLCNKRQETTEWINRAELAKPLSKQFEQLWNVSVIPWWIGLVDVFSARVHNGIPLPPGVTQSMFDDVLNVSLWQLNYLYKPKEISRLGIGSFLGELSDTIADFVEKKTDVKWTLYSAHDTTLGLVLSALNILQGTGWPPYAGHLIFELHEISGNHFVRVIYNGNMKVIPQCGKEYCPFEDFRKLVHPLVPVDWEAECGISKTRYTFLRTVPESEVSAFLC